MKLLRSFLFAFAGIRSAFGSEVNFRIHTVAGILALSLSAVLKISTTEWILVCFCIAFVLVAELLNTALEKLCDAVHPDVHPGIKKVKDMAAGAVLIAALFSIAAGMIIFLPKIIEYLKSI